MATFTTINDVIDAVRDGLGEFADEFDCESIAREVSEWQDGKLVSPLFDRLDDDYAGNIDEYTAILQKHEIR